LLYVGIIGVIGDTASEDATALFLLHFTITYLMSWRIWADIATLTNWLETGDFMQRLSILLYLTCLLGFTVNIASAFEVTFTAMVAFYLAERLFQTYHTLRRSYYYPFTTSSSPSRLIFFGSRRYHVLHHHMRFITDLYGLARKDNQFWFDGFSHSEKKATQNAAHFTLDKKSRQEIKKSMKLGHRITIKDLLHPSRRSSFNVDGVLDVDGHHSPHIHSAV
jgi:hypothetical protein